MPWSSLMFAGKGPEVGAGVWGWVSVLSCGVAVSKAEAPTAPPAMAPVAGLGGKGQVWPCKRRQLSQVQTPAPGQGWVLEHPSQDGACSPNSGAVVSYLTLSQETLKGERNAGSLSAGHCARGCVGRAMALLF